jgi:vanillate O-demethylase monooxygenase subunit
MQQRRIAREPDRPLIDIASDVGGRQTRQFIQRLFRAEQEREGVEA